MADPTAPAADAVFDVRRYGATGDGETLDTRALTAAAEACRDAGGGTLLVPPGVYVTGGVRLYSHTTLHLQQGARLLGSPRLEDHEYAGAMGGMIFACDADGVTLEGEGTIDGNAPLFFEEGALHVPGDYDRAATRQGMAYGNDDPGDGPLKVRAEGMRPGNMIVLSGCTRVRLQDLHVTGSAYWTIHLADCEDVLVRNLDIDADPRHPNNDGIHLTTCRRAVVEDCRISTGDDAVAITGFNKAGGERQIALGLRGLVGACEDITVRRCRLSSRSAAVRIGYGKNPCRRVRLEDLDCTACNRGIGIFARQAAVEDVTVRRVRQEGDTTCALRSDGAELAGEFALPPTGGYSGDGDDWTTTWLASNGAPATLKLTPGEHEITLVNRSGTSTLDWVKLVPLRGVAN